MNAIALTAAKPTVLTPLLAEKRQSPTMSDASPKSATADTAEKGKAAVPAEDAQKAQRIAAKDQAKARVLQLIERLKAIKQFASDNPEVMAKQLAQIAKELKSALKAYAEAGGSAAGWQTSLSTSTSPAQAADAKDGDAQAADPKDVYRQMKDEVSGSEAASDMDLLKQAKGIVKTIRDFLTKAIVQTGVKGPGDDMKKDVEDTATTLKEVEKSIDRMDGDIRASSPAAGMFVTLYA